MSLSLTLAEVLGALEEHAIPHALIGGLAAMAWGRPRTTLDIDIVVDASPLALRAIFARLGYREGRAVGDPMEPDFTQFWSPGGVRVDLFFARTDFEREALALAVDITLVARPARIVSAESSIVYKLIAHRPRDLEDVEAILVARSASLDWERIERWSKEWELETWLAPFRARFRPGASRS